jgi:hypothetical protein
MAHADLSAALVVSMYRRGSKYKKKVWLTCDNPFQVDICDSAIFLIGSWRRGTFIRASLRSDTRHFIRALAARQLISIGVELSGP